MGKRAVGFFREPTSTERDGGASLRPMAEQHRRFVEHCGARGYDVLATFVDGREGDGELPAFAALLALTEREGDGLVAVLDTASVLSADRRLAVRRLYELLATGIEVEPAGDVDRDLITELLGVAGAHGAEPLVADRVREAMRRKAVKGEVLGRSPYGYRVGNRRRLEPVPDEAEVVRYIFRMYIHEGLGIRLIARRLNEEGFRTRRDGAWSMVTIRDILRNRVYLGTYARFGVRVPGSHQALVASDEFRKAQERMASRRTSGGPRTVSPFLLSGRAVCGACGGNMIGVSRRQRWTRRSDGGVSTAEYRYYQCGSRTNQSVCAYHTHRAEDLDELVRSALIQALETDSLAPAAAPERDSGPLEEQRTAADRELDRLTRRMLSHPREWPRLHLRALDAARSQQTLQEELRARAAGEWRSPGERARASALDSLRDRWEQLGHDERRALIEAVLDQVLVYDKHVQVALTA